MGTFSAEAAALVFAVDSQEVVVFCSMFFSGFAARSPRPSLGRPASEKTEGRRKRGTVSDVGGVVGMSVRIGVFAFLAAAATAAAAGVLCLSLEAVVVVVVVVTLLVVMMIV